MDSPEYTDRFQEIKSKLEKKNLPSQAKEYYLKHLEDFASVYFRSGQPWRNESFFQQYFTQCRYDLDDSQYAKLRKYVKAGNIITTIGCINDLKFLAGRTVSVVDT